MSKLDKSAFAKNSETPDTTWVRDFAAILRQVEGRLKDEGFAARVQFTDEGCRKASMYVSRDGISHTFSLNAKGRISPLTIFHSDSFKLCPRIEIDVPGETKTRLVTVTEEEYDESPLRARVPHIWTFSKYRVQREVSVSKSFQTYGVSHNGTAVNADKDVEIAQFISGQMGDLAREKRYASPHPDFW